MFVDKDSNRFQMGSEEKWQYWIIEPFCLSCCSKVCLLWPGERYPEAEPDVYLPTLIIYFKSKQNPMWPVNIAEHMTTNQIHCNIATQNTDLLKGNFEWILNNTIEIQRSNRNASIKWCIGIREQPPCDLAIPKQSLDIKSNWKSVNLVLDYR